MLKRLFVITLVSFIVICVIFFKFLSWRPDIIASVTGRDLLLNTPLSKLVDIERLYVLPENHPDLMALRTQIDTAKAAVLQPTQAKSLNLADLKHKFDLLTGQASIQSMEDAKVLFLASDVPYKKITSSDSELSKFYYWEGPFGFIADDYYFITYNKTDIGQPSPKVMEIEGFCLHQIRKWLTSPDLKSGTVVCVVGRFAGKTELQLANGQKVNVPLLVDCYIDRKKN